MEKVAVYYTKKIDKEHSAQVNLFNIDKWCKEKNYDYILFLDEVKSRKMTTNRFKLEELKEAVKNGEYKKIIIPNLEAISRNPDFNLELIRFVEKYNCVIESMDKYNPHDFKKFVDEIYARLGKEREEKQR